MLRNLGNAFVRLVLVLKPCDVLALKPWFFGCACVLQEITIFRRADKQRKPIQQSNAMKMYKPVRSPVADPEPGDN